MTLQEAMQTLAALGNEKVRARHRKLGSGDNLFGVQRGDLRQVAAKIKRDHHPVSKGCTSPFAPIWIAEMVRRKD